MSAVDSKKSKRRKNKSTVVKTNASSSSANGPVSNVLLGSENDTEGCGEAELKSEENQCQCHACLQQQGQTLPMTLPQHPNCENHNEDNCDSSDDSCSEKSSSSSASSQKDGSKYCDCCYCEFFGHGTPPAAQTSKNYAEMRERLRRRLKRRQTEDGKEDNVHDADPLEMKGLEELLRFINGTEMENKV